jgi:hypothetical protein
MFTVVASRNVLTALAVPAISDPGEVIGYQAYLVTGAWSTERHICVTLVRRQSCYPSDRSGSQRKAWVAAVTTTLKDLPA